MESRDSNSTPEKQLLKLIEQPGSMDQQKETLKRNGIALLSPSVMRGKLSFFKERMRGYLATKKKASLGVEGMNRILAFCTLAMAAYLAVDIIGAIRELNQTIALEPAPWEGGDMPSTSSAGKLHYAEKIGNRDIFNFKSHARIVKNIVGLPVKKTDKDVMRELLEGVELIAVSMIPEPTILLKGKGGGTRFWKEGDTMNGVKIIKIFKDNVLMKYKEEEEFLRR